LHNFSRDEQDHSILQREARIPTFLIKLIIYINK
jgi:hypothetical protein